MSGMNAQESFFQLQRIFPHDYGKVTSTLGGVPQSTRPKSCVETSRGKGLCSLTNKAYFGTIDHAQAISCDILPYPTAPKAHKMGEGRVKSQPTRSFLPSFLPSFIVGPGYERFTSHSLAWNRLSCATLFVQLSSALIPYSIITFDLKCHSHYLISINTYPNNHQGFLNIHPCDDASHRTGWQQLTEQAQSLYLYEYYPLPSVVVRSAYALGENLDKRVVKVDSRKRQIDPCNIFSVAGLLLADTSTLQRS